MTFTPDDEKRIYFAGFSFFFAIIFLSCCLLLLNQSASLFFPYHEKIQSEGNQKNLKIFQEQLKSGELKNVTRSHISNEIILISFDYSKIETIKHKKKKGQPDEPDTDISVEESLEFVQKRETPISNPHQITIKNIDFNDYHQKKATPIAILGAIAFLLSAVFRYKRDKVLYTEYY